MMEEYEAVQALRGAILRGEITLEDATAGGEAEVVPEAPPAAPVEAAAAPAAPAAEAAPAAPAAPAADAMSERQEMVKTKFKAFRPSFWLAKKRKRCTGGVGYMVQLVSLYKVLNSISKKRSLRFGSTSAGL